MRKLLILLLIFALCCPCAAAAEQPEYLALAFDGCPREMQPLLDGLEARNARASFFLRAEECDYSPELLAHGHEIGIFSQARQEMSRRAIAGEITEIRDQLHCRVRFLRPGSGCFDALRQVARAQRLAILETSLDPWADAPMGRTVLERAKDGNVLLLDAGVDADTVLNLIDLLQKQGFVFVTLSELARLRNIHGDLGE